MLNVVKAASAAVLVLWGTSSYAATCTGVLTGDTCTLTGDNVVYEYNNTQAALGLFGSPTVVGDGVRFLPPSFGALSNGDNGDGAVVSTANFVFSNVYTLSGNSLQTIAVGEFGDYEITNGDSVSADLLLTVASNTYIFDNISDSDSFDASGDSAGLQTWDMSAFVDPFIEFQFATDTVSVSIQNTLTATTNAAGELAWIQKKLSFIASEDSGVLPPEIPIPAAAWLFGSALLGLMGVARRKRV